MATVEVLSEDYTKVIHQLMKARRITQADIARAIDRNQAYVSTRLRNKIAWTIDDLAGVAALLGINFAVLASAVADQSVLDDLLAASGSGGQNVQTAEVVAGGETSILSRAISAGIAAEVVLQGSRYAEVSQRAGFGAEHLEQVVNGSLAWTLPDLERYCDELGLDPGVMLVAAVAKAERFDDRQGTGADDEPMEVYDVDDDNDEEQFIE